MKNLPNCCVIAVLLLLSPNLFAETPELNRMVFRENKGQLVDVEGKLRPEFLFEAPVGNLGIYVRATGITYIFRKERGEEDEKEIYLYRMDMDLEGANIAPEIVRHSASELTSNFYLPHCPEGVLGVRDYDRLEFLEVWPGIDWILYMGEKGMKYDFRIRAGADPSQIRLAYTGADELLLENNSLRVINELGSLSEGPVVTRQAENEIESGFVVEGNLVRFEIGDYDKSSELLVDPPIYWFTFYGDPGNLISTDMLCSAGGDLFLAGASSSNTIPGIDPGGGAWYVATVVNGFDAFYAKFDTSRNPVWLTYYGGSGYDNHREMYMDARGILWSCGATSANNFPVYNPGGGAFFQGTKTGFDDDGYMLAFDEFGVRKWATFYGGSSNEILNSLSGNASGHVFVGGAGSSATGSAILNPGGGAYYNVSTSNPGGVILEFDSTYALVWGTDWEGGVVYKVRVSPSQEINVIGVGSNSALPIVNPGGGAYMDSTTNGGDDYMIARFGANRSLTWSTWLGGSSIEGEEVDLCIDSAGNMFLTGSVQSLNLPLVNPGGGAYQSNFTNFWDLYLASFSSAGSMTWSTYMGGSIEDREGLSCAVRNGKLYLALASRSPNWPVLDEGGGGWYVDSLIGSRDVVIVRLSTSGVLEWSTYLGQSDFGTELFDLETDLAGNVLITGITGWSGGIPQPVALSGYYLDSVVDGSFAAYIIQFGGANASCNVQAAFTPSGSTFCLGDTLLLTNSSTGSTTYSWKLNGNPFSTATNPSVILNSTGPNEIKLLTGSGSCLDSTSILVTVNSLPNIGLIASPATVCAGSPVQLTGSGGSGTYDYSGPGFSQNGVATATLTPPASGSYLVLGTDANGCSDTASVAVTVNALPNIGLVASPSTVCAGTTVQLTGSGGSGTYDYSGPGFSQNGVATATLTPPTSGSYSVVGTDANGCSNTATVAVTVNPLPNIGLVASPSTVCAGTSIQLTGSGGNGTYDYSGPGFSQNGVATATLTPPASGSYSVVGTDANGCSNTATAAVTVNPLPNIGLTATPSTVCLGTPIQLVGSGGNGIYNYTGPGFSQSGVATATVTPPATGVYSVLGTDANGCSNIFSVAVTVNPLPNIGLIASPAIVCAGTPVQLVGSGGSGTYDYSGPGFSQNGVAIATLTPNASGTYSVLGTDANGCSNTASVAVTVNPLPNIGLIASPSTVCEGTPIQLIGSGGNGTYDYSGPGFSQNGVATVTLTPTASGSYTALGTGANGCSNTASVAVTVNFLPAIPTITQNGNTLTSSATTGNQWYFNGSLIPGATGQTHAANQDGNYFVTVTDGNGCSSASAPLNVTVIGIHNQLSQQVEVFPNPASNRFFLRFSTSLQTEVKVSLFDGLGRIVYESALSSIASGELIQVRTDGLAKGAYLVKVESSGGVFARTVLITE